jgi:proline iminopeptidase
MRPPLAATTHEGAPLILRHPHPPREDDHGALPQPQPPSAAADSSFLSEEPSAAQPSNASSSSAYAWSHPLMRHISMQRYDSTYSEGNDDDGSSRSTAASHHDHRDNLLDRVRHWWRAASLRLVGAAGGGAGGPCKSMMMNPYRSMTAASASPRVLHLALFLLLGTAVFLAYEAFGYSHRRSLHRGEIIPIERAQEHYIRLRNDDDDDNDHGRDDGRLQIWCRTWGNPRTGIPVLFVHGGPGNAISDYGTSNSQFFDATKFFVVEVDQRGTGKSRPSVRESCRNMRHYTSISIGQMSRDFEVIRRHLNIDRWLVFGGSWGSTLSLDYGMRYPDRVLGLIIRGIYLNTKQEFDAVYTRNAFLHQPKRLQEFDAWFERAQERSRKDGDGSLLDPNDPKRFFEVYRRMLLDCDRSAIWHWYVFENNLMETVPEDLRDPYKIMRSDYPEAQSVAFFENVLFYHGTFVDPPRLLERLHSLRDLPVWICQGNYDEVCPPKYAHMLVDSLQNANVTVHSHFVNSGHEASDPVMAECLVRRVNDFLRQYPSLD